MASNSASDPLMSSTPNRYAVASIAIAVATALVFLILSLRTFLIWFLGGGLGTVGTSDTPGDPQRSLCFQVTNYYSTYYTMPPSIAEIPGVSPLASIDRWSTPYRLTVGQGGAFSVDSAGPDRVFDTPDDLVYHDLVTLVHAPGPSASNALPPGSEQPTAAPSPTEPR